jgi:acyl carrier protein
MTRESAVDVVQLGRSPEEIEDWLTVRIAAAANVAPDEVDIHLPIADFDLDSSAIVSLTHALSEWLDRDLPVTTLWEHPSIAGLAAVLGTAGESAS